jgi:hypothetical protein
LDRSDGASYGSLAIQLARYASGDRYAGIHLDELGLQSLFAVIALFFGQEDICVIDATARIGNSYLLQRSLSSNRRDGDE